MPECGLKVYDGTGRLARELRVQVPDVLDQPTLDLMHRQCIAGITCSYAVLTRGWTVLAMFLHHQLVPEQAVVTGVRRRAPGRWLTATVPLGDDAGGRGVIGPEMFFRQIDLDADRAWIAPYLLRLGTRLPSRVLQIDNEGMWTWEQHGERFFYLAEGPVWSLFGGGNTPLLRLEQAVHIEAPGSVRDYLWAVGAVPLGRRRRAHMVASTPSSASRRA